MMRMCWKPAWSSQLHSVGCAAPSFKLYRGWTWKAARNPPQSPVVFKFIQRIWRCKKVVCLNIAGSVLIVVVQFLSVIWVCIRPRPLPLVLKEKGVESLMSIWAWLPVLCQWSSGKTSRHISGNGKESQTWTPEWPWPSVIGGSSVLGDLNQASHSTPGAKILMVTIYNETFTSFMMRKDTITDLHTGSTSPAYLSKNDCVQLCGEKCVYVLWDAGLDWFVILQGAAAFDQFLLALEVRSLQWLLLTVHTIKPQWVKGPKVMSHLFKHLLHMQHVETPQ